MIRRLSHFLDIPADVLIQPYNAVSAAATSQDEEISATAESPRPRRIVFSARQARGNDLVMSFTVTTWFGRTSAWLFCHLVLQDCGQHAVFDFLAHYPTSACEVISLEAIPVSSLARVQIPLEYLHTIPMQHARIAADMVVDVLEIFDAVRLP
jgi:hypothetical protein